MTAEAWVVVANGAHYGPFPTRRAAAAWANHPHRTFVAFAVLPLFGGVLLDDLAVVTP